MQYNKINLNGGILKMRKIKALIALPILVLNLASCGNNEDNPEQENPTGEGANISFFGWGSNEEQANFKQLVNFYN